MQGTERVEAVRIALEVLQQNREGSITDAQAKVLLSALGLGLEALIEAK